MATFTDFTNVLPDPSNRITYDGSSTASNAGDSFGPGYSSVKLSSKQPYLKDMTNSGRLLARAVAAHNWEVSIDYNPMTREEFDPIYTFLLHRRGPMNPFFVSLPQYSAPKDATFASWVNSSNFLEVDTTGSGESAGATSMIVDGNSFSYNYTTNGTPRPGDLFTFDAANSNHKKAYMITRVETPANRQSSTSLPDNGHLKIHFTPGLQKSVVAGDNLVFDNPLIRVVLNSEVQEYSLNTNNLYSFSLKLEEVQ